MTSGERRPETGLERVRKAIAERGAYRASTRASLGNGDELYMRFDPVASNEDWLFLEVPAIRGPEADIDAWEGATLGTSSAVTALHNINYAAQESSNASVTQSTTNGTIDTTNADITEESSIGPAGSGYTDSQSSSARTWWRVIPPGEDITIRVTNQSGAAETYSMNIVFHERSDWANQSLI